MPLSQQRKFLELVDQAQACRLCPRMEGRKRVLTTQNGNIRSPVIFIAEAPGRNGADRTGIPIYGDPTGHNFELLLASIGWRRDQVFCTNAVLCNPRTPEGTNDSPTETELKNCSRHLIRTLEVVNPEVIVTLGAKALGILCIMEEHRLVLNKDVAQVFWWRGKKLFPLYHPSPRAFLSRSFRQQREDFRKLADVLGDLHADK